MPFYPILKRIARKMGTDDQINISEQVIVVTRKNGQKRRI